MATTGCAVKAIKRKNTISKILSARRLAQGSTFDARLFKNTHAHVQKVHINTKTKKKINKS